MDGDAFIYYKIIRGIEYINVSNPNSALRRSLAKGIAKFCQELHSINTDLINFIDTSQFDASSYQLDGKGSLLENILGNDYQKDLEKRIDYINNYSNFNPEDNVLCHDDIHEENIIVGDNKLSGIIDFGVAVKRKRDVDFAHLLEYDYRLASMVINEYEKLTGKEIDREYIYNIQKIRCYGLLIWCIEQNNKKYTELFKKFIVNLNKIKI
jgi:aminoglycoside phosphotransferase (APT) family kinase protein